ncbi:MAG: cell wall metabolism sensor histidine kinase WalK [Clostridiales bacterium]|nr:cell wall metabolism sensor histidine kinase WalK [Clostridiales bacterium]
MSLLLILTVVLAVILVAVLFVMAHERRSAAARQTQTEESCMRRVSLFETAVSRTGDGILILDAEGNFLFINEAAKQALGVTASDIEAGRYDEVVSGFSVKLQRESILNAASEGDTEERVNFAGGIYRVRFRRLQQEGARAGTVCVISDITESYKAEDMQTDFVANVSHELKTPLTTVKSYAETLLSGGTSDPGVTREFLEIIDSEAARMGRLVSDLLLMSRLDDSRQHIEMTDGDLALLTRSVIQKLDGPARSKDLALNRMFDEALTVQILMDRDRMEQVIHNILSNAIKYTDEGGRIDVDLLPAANCVQIVISDNGIGIPEEAQARVFERFFTVDKARSRRLGGTGLGLAISRQIVEGHGGSIGLESKYGEGTTVTVMLPVAHGRGMPGIL